MRPLHARKLLRPSVNDAAQCSARVFLLVNVTTAYDAGDDGGINFRPAFGGVTLEPLLKISDGYVVANLRVSVRKKRAALDPRIVFRERCFIVNRFIE
jgi:hypothetical protein